MRDRQDRKLSSMIAKAFAIMAMAMQVLLAPNLMQQHAYAAETDYGLSIICGHQGDPSATDQDAPPSQVHIHDCPCCFSGQGHALLPEPAAIPALDPVPAIQSGPVITAPQVQDMATVSHAQLPRAPPISG